MGRTPFSRDARGIAGLAVRELRAHDTSQALSAILIRSLSCPGYGLGMADRSRDLGDESDERSLGAVLVIVGAVAVGLGAAAKHFGADATIGLIMVSLGISALRRPQ